MKMKLLRCVSSTDVILDEKYNFVSRPTDFNIDAEVYFGVDGRCHILMADGNDLHTSTVQDRYESNGYYIVMTRNSAYIFKMGKE